MTSLLQPTLRRFAALGGAGLLALSCTAAPRPTTSPRSEAGPATPGDGDRSISIQVLIRVRYSGPAGSGGFRLTLRQAPSGRYQLSAVEPLGRSLWSLEVGPSGTLWVDYRNRVFCTAETIDLGEPALRSLPPAVLPRVLLGLSPLAATDPPGDTHPVEVTDSEGRRWRIRSDDDGLAAWTLFVEDAPTLWWTREGKGGILSHRDGSQFRWRRIVEEPLSGGLPELEIPSGFERVGCDVAENQELRQGQP